MWSAKFFSLCFILYQVRGAPQLVNLAWIHPSSMMTLDIRPQPNSGPSDTRNAVIPSIFQLQQHTQVMPALEDVSNEDSLLEPEYQEKMHRQNSQQECDPRKWFQRSSCYNTTTVRTCTLGGTYRYSQCFENWSCVTGLGFCMRTFRSVGSFKCPEYPGTYPDPYNCMVYYVCPQGNDTTPLTNTCFYPQIYDPLTQSCQMENSERPCYKINCVGREHAAYPGDPNIYANCSRNGDVENLNRCALGLGWIDETQKCEAHYCIKEGNIAADEPNQYYTCSRIFRKLMRSEVKNCVGSLVFNATLGLCSVYTPESRNSLDSTLTGQKPLDLSETLYHEVPDIHDLVRDVQPYENSASKLAVPLEESVGPVDTSTAAFYAHHLPSLNPHQHEEMMWHLRDNPAMINYHDPSRAGMHPSEQVGPRIHFHDQGGLGSVPPPGMPFPMMPHVM